VVLLALVLAVPGVSACGGPTPAEKKFEKLHLTLYLPKVPGAVVGKSRVRNHMAETDYRDAKDPSTYLFTLSQRPVPSGGLCRTLLAPDHQSGCHVRGGVLSETFEEMSTAGAVRGQTMLVAFNLVTEEDPTLLPTVIRALRTAPRVKPDELAHTGRS
jgi:hypothetical protein